MKISIAFCALCVLTAVGPCTITHKYGPYQGKVVEVQSGDPVEGAYVMTAFYTEMYTFGGFVSEFVDLKDAVTDKNGAFIIEAYRAWAFRFLRRWNPGCYATIYKPGYEAFPSYGVQEAEFKPFYSIPPKEHSIVRLRKLITNEERQSYRGPSIPADIPEKKLKMLRMLLDEEHMNSRHEKALHPKLIEVSGEPPSWENPEPIVGR